MALGLVLYWSSLFTLLPNPWVPAYHADIGICGFVVCMVAFVAACRSDCLCVRCMIGRPTCPPPTCPLSGSAALSACRSGPCIITASVEGLMVLPPPTRPPPAPHLSLTRPPARPRPLTSLVPLTCSPLPCHLKQVRPRDRHRGECGATQRYVPLRRQCVAGEALSHLWL